MLVMCTQNTTPLVISQLNVEMEPSLPDAFRMMRVGGIRAMISLIYLLAENQHTGAAILVFWIFPTKSRQRCRAVILLQMRPQCRAHKENASGGDAWHCRCGQKLVICTLTCF